jgi:hypothetical protein
MVIIYKPIWRYAMFGFLCCTQHPDPEYLKKCLDKVTKGPNIPPLPPSPPPKEEKQKE